MRQYKIKLVETEEGGLTPKHLEFIRNALSDFLSGDGVKIQLAWANALLDAGLTKRF